MGQLEGTKGWSLGTLPARGAWQIANPPLAWGSLKGLLRALKRSLNLARHSRSSKSHNHQAVLPQGPFLPRILSKQAEVSRVRPGAKPASYFYSQAWLGGREPRAIPHPTVFPALSHVANSVTFATSEYPKGPKHHFHTELITTSELWTL